MSSERVQAIEIAGPAGPLEALYHFDQLRAPSGAAVICHPHPQYGGNFHNKVVHRIDRSLFQARNVCLRFNYRGVGASAGAYAEGLGERDDTLAAVEEMLRRHPALPLCLAGFSFGASRAAEVGAMHPRVARLILVGAGPGSLAPLDSAPRKPILFVHGEKDELCLLASVVEWVDAHPGRATLVVVPGADYFFQSSLGEVERAIAAFVAVA